MIPPACGSLPSSLHLGSSVGLSSSAWRVLKKETSLPLHGIRIHMRTDLYANDSMCENSTEHDPYIERPVWIRWAFLRRFEWVKSIWFLVSQKFTFSRFSVYSVTLRRSCCFLDVSTKGSSVKLSGPYQQFSLVLMGLSPRGAIKSVGYQSDLTGL